MKRVRIRALLTAAATAATAVTSVVGTALLPRTAEGAYSAANTFDLNRSGMSSSQASGICGTSIVGYAEGTFTSRPHGAVLWYALPTYAVDFNPTGNLSSSELYDVDGTHHVGFVGPDGTMYWPSTNPDNGVNLTPSGSGEVYGISGSQQCGATPSGAAIWSGTAASRVDLHPTSTTFTGSIARDTNGTQQVGDVTTTFTNSNRAALWSSTAASFTLLHPASGYTKSTAWGVVGNQQVGQATDAGGFNHAMLWTGSAASVVDLSPSGLNSIAYDTNGVQQVGFVQNGVPHAALWSGTAASFQDLHSLVPGAPAVSEARAIDGYGNIAGYAFGTKHAVVWYAGDVFHGNESSTWNDASNWTSGIPAAGQDVLFIKNHFDPVFVIYPSGVQPALNNLTIDNAGGGGSELFVPGSRKLQTTNTLIGFVGVEAYLHLSGGGTHVVTGKLSLGAYAGGGVGNYDIAGASSILTVSTEYVGEFTTGRFVQSSGTHAVTNQLIIASSPGVTGTYQMFGGTLNVNNSVFSTLFVGARGSATMTQSGGTANIAQLVIGAGFSVSDPPAGNGTYNLNSTGVANVTSLAVGGSSLFAGKAGVLNISAGNMTVSGAAKIWNLTDTALNLSGGTLSVGSLDSDGNPSRLNWTGGTLEFTNSNPAIGAGQHLGTALTLATGKTLRIKGNSQFLRVLSTGTLSFTGGKLDLTDKKIISSSNPVGSWNGSAYTDLTGQIASGRNGNSTPLWDGVAGVITSQSTAVAGNLHSIGIARGSEVKSQTVSTTALWAGATITGTDTLVMYTYGGDATLDGKINIDDYVKIDSGIAGGLAGWSNGDFNYDGKINIDDYTTVIDINIGNQSGVFFTGGGVAEGGSDATAVPEPVAGSLLILPALATLRRRRRALARSACSKALG